MAFSLLWPDPNSPLLEKIDFGVPVSELLKWLFVRDTFVGENEVDQNIRAALKLARDCKHPDAIWLVSIFEGKDVSTKEEARKVFLLHETDARALCFAWWMSYELALLRRAAAMGNAFACATLCGEIRHESMANSFRLAQLAAAQNERDGFLRLGVSLRSGYGCEKNLHSAKENYLIAAELGSFNAAINYADILDEFDPVRWFWRGRGAMGSLCFSFLFTFSKQVDQFFCGSGSAQAVFFIGRALKGNIDIEKRLMFGTRHCFDGVIGPANQAVSFYDSQIKCARLAVDTWTLVGIRLGMVKDMRVLIGKLIWEGRFEANYKI